MNQSKKNVSIIVSIFLIIFGSIFLFVGNMLEKSFEKVKETGEQVEAFVLETYSGGENENSYTKLEIVDENSIYEGEIVEVSLYNSSISTGDYITIWYNGNDAIIPGMDILVTIFHWVGVIVVIIGVVIIVIKLIKMLLLGVVIGSLYHNEKQQQQINNKNGFVDNNSSIDINLNNQYQQPYNQQPYNQQNYNQQNYKQQNYNQQNYNQQNYNQQNYNN